MSIWKWKYNPLNTFYIVFSYIIAFSIWWALLLYMKNETAFNENVALNVLRYQSLKAGEEFKQTEEYRLMHSKYQRQKTMIVTEGAVFIALLIGGLWQVRSSIKREMQAMQQQSNFLHSVTHELKSPLASIKLNVQTIQQRKLDSEQLQTLIQHSIADVERLEGLVENILLAAKVESITSTIEQEAVQLSVLVEDLLKRYLHNPKHIRISAFITPDVVAWADKQSVVSMFTNLMENAIKYSATQTQILVKLSSDGVNALLQVADEGAGIAHADKQRVFEKFYRVGNEETRSAKGTGLGLYIVKRLAEMNGGSVWVDDNHPRGSIFTLRLPLKNMTLL